MVLYLKIFQKASIGVVVRNSQGEIMAALSEKIPMPSSVVLLETLAARRAVLFIHGLGFRGSIFEGDSTISINVLCHNKFLQSSLGHIIKETLYHASSLQSLFFYHTLKQCNAWLMP